METSDTTPPDAADVAWTDRGSPSLRALKRPLIAPVGTAGCGAFPQMPRHRAAAEDPRHVVVSFAIADGSTATHRVHRVAAQVLGALADRRGPAQRCVASAQQQRHCQQTNRIPCESMHRVTSLSGTLRAGRLAHFLHRRWRGSAPLHVPPVAQSADTANSSQFKRPDDFRGANRSRARRDFTPGIVAHDFAAPLPVVRARCIFG